MGAERRAVAYGYARVSTRQQARDGYSMAAQAAEHKRYYESRLGPAGVVWGGTFADPETSGGVKLADRKAGRELLMRLAPGDHVLVTELSRAWRKFRDMVSTMEEWFARGIHVHIIRSGIDTSTEWGKLMARIMAAFAEMERQLAAERTREALRNRKREGKQINQHPGYGRRLDGQRGHRRPVDDPKELELMERIVRMHDAEGETFEQIYWSFFKADVRTRGGKLWSKNRIYRAYLAQKSRGG